MPDTWVTDITHFLDEHGELIKEPKEARRLAEYFTSIVVMASHPEPEYPKEYRVLCRRKPNRKKCGEEIVGFIDLDTDDINWMCPKCGEQGRINNWRGTIWDMSDCEGKVIH